MTQDPEKDVADYLVTLSPVAGFALVAATTLFRGPPLSQEEGVPTEAVFVEVPQAEAPEPLLAQGSEWPAEVEITVRGPANDRETARIRARALLHALHRAPIPGYASVVSMDGEPEYMGREGMTHEYSFAIALDWVA